MRTFVRRTAPVLALALGALLSSTSPADAVCTPTNPNNPNTGSYAFYTTDNGQPAPASLAPAGYLYNANTTFEDNPANIDLCLVTSLHVNPGVDVYICKGIPADPSYNVTFTDDGDMLDAAGNVIDVILP
jgi:hypothetical protein